MVYDRNAKKHQEAHTNKLKDRTNFQKYEIIGLEINVAPNVFTPQSDTRLFAKNIKVKPGDLVLELTTGSGILSIIAAKQGAKVVAVDINKFAIECARRNFKKHNVEITTVVSDLFSNVPPKKYDYIFANGPYFKGKINNVLEYASMGVNKFIDNLFEGLPRYLKKNGALWITFAEYGEIDTFYKALKRHNLFYKVLDSGLSPDRKRRYNRYEVRLS